MTSVGLTHGGFYRHFDSKDEIISESLQRVSMPESPGLKSMLRVRQRQPNSGAGLRKETTEQAYVRRASLAYDTLLQGKWRVQILCAMRIGPVRLGQLVRMIPNGSRKMLVQNLRSLESAGIVIRRDLSDVSLHVEYDLEPGLRSSICLLLDELSNWGGLYSQKSIGEGYIGQDGFGTEETG